MGQALEGIRVIEIIESFCSVISNLDWPASFLLDHRGAVPYLTADAHVIDLEPHEVAAAQFAVDREIEKGEIASAPLKLQPDTDCPDLFWLQRSLLANQPAFCSTGLSRSRQATG